MTKRLEPAHSSASSTPSAGATFTIERTRVRRAAPFVAMAIVMTIAGGLLAAVASVAGWEAGPWAAAYLVLVGGVAQGVLGVGRVALASTADHVSLAPALVLWNLGNFAVLAGTMLDTLGLTIFGSLLLVSVLIRLALSVRRSIGRAAAHRRWGWGYQVFVVFLLISVVVGCVLALPHA